MTKYHAQRTTLFGETFDSKGEAFRWRDLRLLEQAGTISELRRQVKYRLTVNGVDVCAYVADFTYFENGRYVVEDFKGIRTSTYRLKKKLMRAIKGIEILETGAAP